MDEKRLTPPAYANLYAHFDAPISALNCGDRCAPHNERGVPFCCDTRHAVPTVYTEEWLYLQENTDLWHPWEPDDPREKDRLLLETPEGMRLVECLGHAHCQRGFRALTCRAFPFYPYLTSEREFTGMSYYWEYEDRCWVISNLQVVSAEYREAFMATFDELFKQMPEERASYAHHASQMRRHFARRKRAIPLLHRDGGCYKINPRTEHLRKVQPESLPKFGPYKIAALMPFPDEMD
jgi:hypothetical protein